MPPFPDAVLLLAGLTLGHAAWIVSDLPPQQLLAPFAIKESAGQRYLQPFEAETQAIAIAGGKAEAAKWTLDSIAWAFAREGSVRDSGKETDVLSVDFWAPGMPEPATIVQRFQRNTVDGHFHLLGPMQVIVAGKMLPDSAAAETVRSIRQGVAQHPRVASLWDTWK